MQMLAVRFTHNLLIRNSTSHDLTTVNETQLHHPTVSMPHAPTSVIIYMKGGAGVSIKI